MSEASTQSQAEGTAYASGISAADILRILRKKIWLILACLLLVGGGGTAALFAWRYLKPYYTAEGTIEVEVGQPGRRGAYTGDTGAEVPVQLFENFMLTQVARIESQRVLETALRNMMEDPQAQPTSYIGPQGLPMVRELAEDISVTFVPGSQYIRVSLTGEDPAEIQGIVRYVLDAYVADVQGTYERDSVQRQADLRRAREGLQRQAEDLGNRLNAFLAETGEAALDGRGEVMGRLRALTNQLVAQQRVLAEQRAAWEQFQLVAEQAREEGNAARLSMLYPEIGEQLRRDPTLAAKTGQVLQASETLDLLKQRYGPQHEVVRRQEQLYQRLNNELEEVRGQTMSELIEQQGRVLQGSYERAREAEADLRDQVAQTRAEANRLAQRAADYQAMQHEYERVQEQLGEVTAGLEQMRIQLAINRPHVKVLQYPPPIPEDEVSQPKLFLYVPAVIFFSLFLGVGLSVLLELADAKLRTPSQVVRQVGLPLLGCVPDLSEDERLSMGVDVSRVTQSAPESLIAEAFRQFRTSLRFASDSPLKSILITSPNPGDGKTVAASNLATAMARSGTRVLLVEANLRRPALARVFDVPDSVGLSNVLVGLNSLDEAVQATNVENLDVLPGGPLPPSPADLLGSERMRQILHEASDRYDTVLVDAAPMLVVADAHLLVQAVDGVVLVLRAGENTRGLAVRAARAVLGLRARLLGAVLNSARATRGGYFREAYQAYYDYAGSGPQGQMLAAATAAPPGSQAESYSARPIQQASTATAVEEQPGDDEDEAELIEGEGPVDE